jgi:transcriptional regulator with XRE-family HTH domain
MSVPQARRHSVAVAFGEVLRAARKRRGISQEQLGLDADLDRTYPSLLERGLRTPTLTALFEIPRVLCVEPTQLVDETLSRLRGGQSRW